MKKIAFTCSSCGFLNVPAPGDDWRGFQPCRHCGALERVAADREVRTARKLYRELAVKTGLSVGMILKLQKRGLLPRDLATRSWLHETVASAVALAVGSEEILRGGLARLPKKHRKTLVHDVPSDGHLTRWQRDVLNRYLKEYQEDLANCPKQPAEKRGQRYGSVVTSIPDMIRYLEEQHRLSPATSRPWIKRLKKAAYNRVLRALKGGPHGK